MPALFIPCFFSLLFSSLISFYIGTKKKIGWWWSLFFCLTFTPVIGLFFTCLSPPKHQLVHPSSFVADMAFLFSIPLILLGIVLVTMGITGFIDSIPGICAGLGITGIGIRGIRYIRQTAAELL